jgi:hypothetical protein
MGSGTIRSPSAGTPMSVTENRSLRTVLIPWVIALVTLFGLNAIAPNHARSRKSEPQEGIGLSQPANDAQTSGRVSNPLVFVATTSRDDFKLLNQPSWRLPIETPTTTPTVRSPKGAVQGRAPPGMSYC